jgi:photosynthetic reaction center cytochrome c subunit
VSDVLASIAGRENQPATQVFKNVTFLRNVTARQLVDTMGTYGRAQSWNCTNCHVVTDYSSDSRHDKGLARTMQQMTAAINREWMPKINAQKPPTVSCMTCHRGYNIPTDSIDLRAWWPLGKPPA